MGGQAWRAGDLYRCPLGMLYFALPVITLLSSSILLGMAFIYCCIVAKSDVLFNFCSSVDDAPSPDVELSCTPGRASDPSGAAGIESHGQTCAGT